MMPLATALSECPVGIRFVPAETIYFGCATTSEKLGPYPSVQMAHPPLSVADQLSKRCFDFAVAGAALVILAPLLVMVAILIKLDSRGPVLFTQVRYGYRKQPIRVLKFRTMFDGCSDGEFHETRVGDRRITQLGRLLRRTNIDELPQIFNVLRGDMSLVGPRPHALAHQDAFEGLLARYARRHAVKPGITGWAQVNDFRGATDTLDKMKYRLEHDLFYIDNWSLLLDIQIVALTLLSPKAYLNAY